MKKNFQSHSHLLLDDQKQSVLTQRNVAALLEVHLLRNRSGELKKNQENHRSDRGCVQSHENIRQFKVNTTFFRFVDHLCLFLR